MAFGGIVEKPKTVGTFIYIFMYTYIFISVFIYIYEGYVNELAK